jgi:PAS domain S-box-containing protein/putative nucleotidyltransferase with HDIG domain
MKRFIPHTVFRISLFYLLFGSLWIAISDRILELFITDAHRMSTLQTYKGWFFVLISALLLYLVVRREFRVRKKAEAALRDSEEKYRMLLLNATDGIVLADVKTGEILEVNRKIEELTGRSAKELIGMHLPELHPERDSGPCKKMLEQALDTGHSLSSDLCILRRDGRDVPVEISTSITAVGGRNIVQAIFRDITLRMAADASARKEKERAAQYLDIAGVILVVLDRTGAVSLINRKGSVILGYPEEEIIGQNWFDRFIPERLRPELRTLFSRLLDGEGETVEYYENPIMRKDGTECMIAWHNTLIRDGEGVVVSTLSSGEDITARKMAEEQARNRLEHLTTLHAIDMIINSSLDLRVTLQEMLDLAISQLHVDAAAVLLLNRHTQMLEFAAMQGFRDARMRHSQMRLGEGVAGRAALEQQSIFIPNLSEAEEVFARTALIEGENFVSYYAVPLIARGQVKGVLDILHRSRLNVDDEWLSLLDSLAAQAALAIDNATLFNDLQRSNTELILAYDTTIEGWARALELRDRETEGHTQRTAELTLLLARAMGMGEAELVHVRRGALLHDIGKMSIPDSILLKTGSLTDEEWRIMRQHPVYAFELLMPIAYLRPALDIPYCHHEWWDGSGYPRGLKGDKIPLAARIFSLADSWDALNSERRYHPAWPEEQVREHIRSLSGSQFDPQVVERFLNLERSLQEKITA